MTNNKKPGAIRRPGKDKSPRKHTLPMRTIHRRITEESQHFRYLGRPWHPHEFPALYDLIFSALADLRNRRRLKGRMLFWHHGERYVVRLTSLDRLIIEDPRTGCFIASSGFFAL